MIRLFSTPRLHIIPVEPAIDYRTDMRSSFASIRLAHFISLDGQDILEQAGRALKYYLVDKMNLPMFHYEVAYYTG